MTNLLPQTHKYHDFPPIPRSFQKKAVSLRGMQSLLKNSSPFLKAGSAKRDATPLSFQRNTLSLREEGRAGIQ